MSNSISDWHFIDKSTGRKLVETVGLRIISGVLFILGTILLSSEDRGTIHVLSRKQNIKNNLNS